MKLKVKFDRLDEFGKAMTELNEAYERLMQAANPSARKEGGYGISLHRGSHPRGADER